MYKLNYVFLQYSFYSFIYNMSNKHNYEQKLKSDQNVSLIITCFNENNIRSMKRNIRANQSCQILLSNNILKTKNSIIKQKYSLLNLEIDNSKASCISSNKKTNVKHNYDENTKKSDETCTDNKVNIKEKEKNKILISADLNKTNLNIRKKNLCVEKQMKGNPKLSNKKVNNIENLPVSNKNAALIFPSAICKFSTCEEIKQNFKLNLNNIKKIVPERHIRLYENFKSKFFIDNDTIYKIHNLYMHANGATEFTKLDQISIIFKNNVEIIDKFLSLCDKKYQQSRNYTINTFFYNLTIKRTNKKNSLVVLFDKLRIEFNENKTIASAIKKFFNDLLNYYRLCYVYIIRDIFTSYKNYENKNICLNYDSQNDYESFCMRVIDITVFLMH